MTQNVDNQLNSSNLRYAQAVDARCQRAFVFRDAARPIDSNHKRDANRLRPILNEVPDAIAYLDTYQQNRKNVERSAMIGAVGIMVGLACAFVLPNVPGSFASTVKSPGMIVGFGTGAASLIYSYVVLSSNEQNLSSAVEHYNLARPNDTIKLQFSTSLEF